MFTDSVTQKRVFVAGLSMAFQGDPPCRNALGAEVRGCDPTWAWLQKVCVASVQTVMGSIKEDVSVLGWLFF